MARFVELEAMPGLAVVLASGCAPVAGTPAEKPAPRAAAAVSMPPPGDATYAPAWINTDPRPIGPVKAIGSTVVGMVVDDGKLLLIGIDPATGYELGHASATLAVGVHVGSHIVVATPSGYAGFQVR